MTLERYDVPSFIDYLERNLDKATAMRTLLDMYRVTRTFPDLSNFRLGPNMFERIPLDWIIMIEDGAAGAPSRLVAHGVTARMPWSGEATALPRGWQGAVREVYQNAVGRRATCNTLVGLFIKVEDDFRGSGWAAEMIRRMKATVARCGLSALIIPLRLPRRYEKQYADIPFEEFAQLRREDGEYLDHWLRLHVRLGARVIGSCDTSHQHAMHLDDLYQQVECDRVEHTGYHLVQWNGEWYRAFVDVERRFALIDQGCVWVQHPVEGSS